MEIEEKKNNHTDSRQTIHAMFTNAMQAFEDYYAELPSKRQELEETKKELEEAKTAPIRGRRLLLIRLQTKIETLQKETGTEIIIEENKKGKGVITISSHH